MLRKNRIPIRHRGNVGTGRYVSGKVEDAVESYVGGLPGYGLGGVDGGLLGDGEVGV